MCFFENFFYKNTKCRFYHDICNNFKSDNLFIFLICNDKIDDVDDYKPFCLHDYGKLISDKLILLKKNKYDVYSIFKESLEEQDDKCFLKLAYRFLFKLDIRLSLDEFDESIRDKNKQYMFFEFNKIPVIVIYIYQQEIKKYDNLFYLESMWAKNGELKLIDKDTINLINKIRKFIDY